jgi:hypothetical protein
LTRKLKPVDIPVPEPFRSAMLSVAVPNEDGGFTTVGTLVHEAREAIDRANEALKSNSLVTLAAQDMMKGHRRRGRASVEVGADGTVLLHITYGKTQAPDGVTTAPGGAGLPSLDALRKEAEEYGIDISHLGRQKRKIMDLIIMSRENHNHDPLADDGTTRRLRDEVSTSTPLHTKKLPPR